MFERTISTITWVFTLLLAFAFAGDGLAKLGTRHVDLAGALEVACALLVLFPRFAHIGAGVLACAAAGMSYAAFAYGGSATLVASLLLLVLALAVGTLRGWGRRDPRAWSGAIDRRSYAPLSEARKPRAKRGSRRAYARLSRRR